MNIAAQAVLLLSAVLSLVGCQQGKGSSNSVNPSPTAVPQPAPAPTASPDPHQPNLPLTLQPTVDSVQHELVDKKCVACHAEGSASNGHVLLTDLNKVILPPNVTAPHDHTDPHFARADLVREGCPEQSFFYTIMKEGKMPLGPAGHISVADLATVEAWIKSLGPPNPPADFCKDPTEPGSDDGSPGVSG